MSSEDHCATASLEWSLIESMLDLPERIRLYRRRPEAFTPDEKRAVQTLDRWRSLLARAESAPMDDRLAELGIVEADLAKLLGAIEESAACEVPRAEWMVVLEEVLAWNGPCGEDGLPQSEVLRRAEGEAAIPFEDALVPWVEVATRRLRRQVPNLEGHLGPDLLRIEQRRLLEDLARFARFACIADLEAHRLGLYEGNDFVTGLLSGTPPRSAYARTVREMVGPMVRAWMARYPALARLLAVRVVAWSRGVAEFLRRLEEDRAVLGETFGNGSALGSLSTLNFGLGDSHNGGRSVAICGFDSGHRVVYKPRSCGVDTAFAAIVEAANAMLPDELRLRSPRTIDRGRWGWAEFIEARPGRDLADLRRYQRRMGALLALIHMLQGNDFHLENLLAVGDEPVPIDLETVCVPDLTTQKVDEGQDPVQASIVHSVLRTMLLPSVIGFRGGGGLQNLGALRVEVRHGKTRKVRRLIGVNTDFQRWAETKPEEERGTAAAWVESGETLEADERISLTQDGYRAAYQAFLPHREFWLGDASPIRRLEASYVRVLNRATNVYARLIQQSCEVENLRTGVDRWLAIDRAFLAVPSDRGDRDRSVQVAVVAAESEALFDGDVAYFVTPGGGTKHWTIDPESTRPVERAGTRLIRSAVESAYAQIERMDEKDLALQMLLQGNAYRSAILSLEGSMHSSFAEAVTVDRTERPRRPLRELVVDVLDALVERGLDSAEGINWIDITLDTRLEIAQPSALSTDLYAGRGGLALLFERAYRALGDRRYLEVAASSLRRELAAWNTSPSMRAEWVRRKPDGMGDRGGLMAGWWAVGRHEGHGAYRMAARELAISFSDRAIEADDGYDIIGGSAGSILLLVRQLQEESIPEVDRVVTRMADHLVKAGDRAHGLGWFCLPNSLPLCGFAHGRAGIALALMEAGRSFDRPDLIQVAEEAFEAEHRLRGTEPTQGWPDYRGIRRTARATARMGSRFWCSGTEGIALSRAAALRISDTPHLRDDLEFALETVRQPPAGRCHLCCGVSGRLLARQSLAHLSAEAPLPAAELEEIISTLLERSLEAGDLGVLGNGLFQGIGGLAWAGLCALDDDGSDLLLLHP